MTVRIWTRHPPETPVWPDEQYDSAMLLEVRGLAIEHVGRFKMNTFVKVDIRSTIAAIKFLIVTDREATPAAQGGGVVEIKYSVPVTSVTFRSGDNCDQWSLNE